MAIRSKDGYYDDITNATMTSAFVIRYEKLTSQYKYDDKPVKTLNPFESEANIFAKKLRSFATKDSNK